MADHKNLWIIPPSGEHTIIVKGAEAGKKVTAESEGRIRLSAEEFQALALGPEAKCVEVYKCTTVGPFDCNQIKITQCFNLIDCTGVKCSDLTTKQ